MRRYNQWPVISAAVMLFAAPPVTAQCTAQSGKQRMALLELYTSEGCSSCPPADRWLADLEAGNRGTAQLAPLSLHVDYWNYIGWIDPFSQAHFTERQQAYSKRGGTRTVYTPQFILNGREYRGWFRGDDVMRQVADINAKPAPATITLKLTRLGPTTLAVTGDVSLTGMEATARGPADVYLALYENNLVSDVRAGENRGQRLRHNYVVRRLEGPLALPANGRLSLRQQFALAPDWKQHDLGVTAFVQDRANGEVLQTAMVLPCLK